MVVPGHKTARRHGAHVMTQGQTGGGNPAEQSGDLSAATAAGAHTESAAATQTATGCALCEICVCLGVLPKAKHIN